MKKKIIPVGYRRKREGKTDYRKRLGMLQTNRPRLVIRKSLKNISCQIIDFKPQGDQVLVAAHSSELKKFGWQYSLGSIPAAYLVGYLLGKKAGSKKITDAIVDLGLQAPVAGSRLYAAVKGAVDAGLKLPYNKEVFPSEDRLRGKHIVDYLGKLSEDKLKKQFSMDVKGLSQTFETVKQKITELK